MRLSATSDAVIETSPTSSTRLGCLPPFPRYVGCRFQVRNSDVFAQDFVYLTLEIRDKAYSNILSCIPITNMFIQEAIDRGGGVLVHW